MTLNKREVQLLEGMITVQLDHATRSTRLLNTTMGAKQRGWDMERVTLITKILTECERR